MDQILAKDESRVYEKLMDNANDLFKQYRSSIPEIEKYFNLLHQKMIEKLHEMKFKETDKFFEIDCEWYSEYHTDPSDRIVADYYDSLEFILRKLYPNSNIRIFKVNSCEQMSYILEAKIYYIDIENNTEYENVKKIFLKTMNERKALENEIRDIEIKLKELKEKHLNNFVYRQF